MGTGTLVRAAPHKMPDPTCFVLNRYLFVITIISDILIFCLLGLFPLALIFVHRQIGAFTDAFHGGVMPRVICGHTIAILTFSQG